MRWLRATKGEAIYSVLQDSYFPALFLALICDIIKIIVLIALGKSK